LGELFSELSRETSTLVRQEVALARTELTAKASQVGKDVGFLAMGGAVAYAGLLAIIAGIIILIGNLIGHMWLSALIVGLIIAGIGYYLVQKGLSDLKNANLAPEQTIESLKENKEWVQEQTK
jgi:drug/metabolite transporter (DMT)-like permease